jgi:hypothetical protein
MLTNFFFSSTTLLTTVEFTQAYILTMSSNTPTSCCATCLSQSAVRGVDAVDWWACSSAQQVCCFDSACRASGFGKPNYDYDLAFLTFDGPNVQLPQGSWFRFTWPSASYVKYMPLKTGQQKLAQVTNSSLEARAKDNVFFICADVPGTLFFRGFNDNGCSASTEFNITVRRRSYIYIYIYI